MTTKAYSNVQRSVVGLLEFDFFLTHGSAMRAEAIWLAKILAEVLHRPVCTCPILHAVCDLLMFVQVAYKTQQAKGVLRISFLLFIQFLDELRAKLEKKLNLYRCQGCLLYLLLSLHVQVKTTFCKTPSCTSKHISSINTFMMDYMTWIV